MHAVFVTFTSSVAVEAMPAELRSYAHAITESDGFISKAWIADGTTLGGFHIFASAEDADGFLAGGLFAGLRQDARFWAFEVRRFDILEDLSALTGLPPRPPSPSVPAADGRPRSF